MNPGGDSFRLVMRRGPSPNQVYELARDNITIGRDITNDIVINDPEVSRHHLRFSRGGGGFTLEDLGSTNGTFINGQRMTGTRVLRPGDMIGLGETVTLAYELIAGPTVQGAAASEAPAAPPAAGPTLQVPTQRPGQAGVSQPFAPGASQPYQAGAPAPGPSQAQPPAASPTTAQPYTPAPGPSQSYAPASQPPPYGPQPGASQQYPAAPGQPVQPSAPGTAYPYASGTGYSRANAPYGTGQLAPGASGYGEYDPYAAGEVKPNSSMRIAAIGCAAVTVFCCCGTLASMVVIDQLCLYQSVPFLYSIIRALGYVAVCP